MTPGRGPEGIRTRAREVRGELVAPDAETRGQQLPQQPQDGPVQLLQQLQPPKDTSGASFSVATMVASCTRGE